MSAPRQGALTEKKFAPARTDQNIPPFPHIPRNGRPDQAGSGKVGKGGNVLAASRSAQIISGGVLSASGAQIR